MLARVKLLMVGKFQTMIVDSFCSLDILSIQLTNFVVLVNVEYYKYGRD